MFGDFRGQKVIVTGAAKGIGKGIANAFAQCGAQVFIGDIDATNGEQTAAAFSQSGYDMKYLPLDVTSATSIKAFYDQVGDFSVLCSNCGIFPQKNLLEMTEEDWDHIHKINLKSTFLMVQEGIRRLLPHQYGRIVLTSSITGPITGYPGWSHYASTKAAMLGFMRSACLEFAKKGITINAVMPGNILTEGLQDQGQAYLDSMAKSVPVGRLGKPEDIGFAAVYLASKEAGYVNGQTIIVDGGQILPETLEAIL